MIFPHAFKADDIQIIKQNYSRLLLYGDGEDNNLLKLLTAIPKEKYFSDQMVVELMEKYPVSRQETELLFEKFRPDGTWEGINYTDNNRSGWQPKNHLSNILLLSKSFGMESSYFYRSEKVEKAIHAALAYWFGAKPVSPNWWHNEIGCPKIMGAIYIVMEDYLSPDEKEQMAAYMENSKFGMTGQNKVWLAGNVLVRALMQNNTELVRMARDTIFSEIRMGEEEGIKADRSFHQHGAQQQFGNYGAAYISGMAFWTEILSGTSLAPRQYQLDILSELINEGYARILWKGNMDINALGRQFFRQAQRHKAFSVGFSSRILSYSDPKNSDKYEALLRENFFSPSRHSSSMGVYHFWQSDMTVQRRLSWMSSVRMSSFRTIGGESVNGDNLRGYYLADGAMYTYVDGREYDNIFPCWDWRKIPGITSYETDLPLKVLTWRDYHNRSNFVGNVNDGQTGITAMYLDRDGLSGCKLWIFADDFILCMGAGIRSDSGLVVTTSIEQRLKAKGPLLHLENNRWKKATSIDINGSKDLRFFHDKTGYIVLDGERVKASVGERTGKWKDVMNMYPSGLTETKDVVSLWIDHGSDPESGSYIYLVIPGTSPSKVKNYNRDKIRINSNTRQFQSVTIGNTTYVAAYPLADIPVTEGIRLHTTNTGLFMISREEGRLKVIVADPTQAQESMQVTMRGQTKTVVLPAGEMKGTPVTVYFD